MNNFTYVQKKIDIFGVDLLRQKRNKQQQKKMDEKPNPWIIMPDSSMKMTWNSVIILLLLYTATFVPYRVAFFESEFAFITVLDWFIDGLFSIDIIINFMSAYEKTETQLETRFKWIAIDYLKSWFIFDVLAIIPF